MTTFLTAPRPSGLASLPADLSSCPAGVNQIIIRQVDYAHDHFMNLEQQAKNIAGAQATEAFTYDELQRIKSGTRSWVYQGLSMSEGDSYTYDDLGNITSKSDYASVYTYGTSARSTRLAGPHAVVAVSGKQSGSASATFTYDWNGNLVDGDGRTIDFDLLDRPVRVARSGAATDFAYAPDGARYRLRISGAVDCVFGPKTVYYVDKDYEVTVWAPCGARTSSVIEERSYLGGSVVVYRRDANPREVRYEHKDRLGSLDAVTKDDPAATELYVDAHGYDPFGKPRARDWTPRAERLHPGGDFYATTDRGFTGHEHLDLHYLIHMNGRVYDYRLGRFLSVDPIISDPANSQSINPYSYIGNNPLSGTDPTGYEACGALVEGCSGLRSGPQAAGARPSLTESELGNHVQTIVINPQESGATGQGSQQSNAATPDKNSPRDTAGANNLSLGNFADKLGRAGEAGQVAKDTVVGAAKEAANTVIGMANAVNRPLDAALSTFTSFRFGQIPEFQGSTPGEKSAMAGVFVLSFFTGAGEANAAGRVALDTNAIIARLERGPAEARAVIEAMAGRTPSVSMTAVKEFLRGGGDISALRSFLIEGGGGVGRAPSAAALKDLAVAGLKPADARVVGSAIQESIHLLTRDKEILKKVPSVAGGF